MPTSQETQTRSQRKRAAIIDAALHEFHANGFENTSMDQIAATANVSKRTVYNHFDSKEVLFEAITKLLIEKVTQLQIQPYDSQVPLETQLREITKQEVELRLSESFLRLARVSLSQLLRLPRLAEETFSEARSKKTGLIEWVEQATADGRLQASDAELAAKQLIGMLDHFFFWPPLLCGHSDWCERKEEVIHSAVAMFLSYYAVDA